MAHFIVWVYYRVNRRDLVTPTKKITENETITLGELTRRFNSGKLQLPLWQRKLIWPIPKQKKWREDIQSGGVLPGVITTFNIIGENINYINDGAQRTLTTTKFAAELESKLGKDAVYEVLDNAKILCQHVEYSDKDEAFKDFYRINQGTLCTSYELGRGVLSTNLPNWLLWEPEIEKLHSICVSVISRMGCRIAKSRETTHKSHRDDYALFLRYATKERAATDDESGSTRLELRDSREALNKVIEFRLCRLLQSLDLDGYGKLLKQFEQFLNEQIAFYETTWKRINKDKAYSPTPTHIRFYLCVAIYRRNNSFTIDSFQEFTEKFIQGTGGASTYIPDSSKRNKITVCLSKLSVLKKLCDIMNIKFGTTDRDYVNRATVKRGYDNSHINPVCVAGDDGHVFWEDHLTNVSRGAKAVK